MRLNKALKLCAAADISFDHANVFSRYVVYTHFDNLFIATFLNSTEFIMFRLF